MRAGFSALSNWRLVLLLTGATVLLSVSAAMPLLPALNDSFAGTLAGDHILRNHPTFAPTDVFDFLREKHSVLSGTRMAARCAALIGLLLQIFFAGGLIEVLGKPGPLSMTDFFVASRRNFWHNVKCFFFFVLAAGIAVGGWIAAALFAQKKLFEETPPAANSTFLFRVGAILVALLLYAVLSLLYDFARAARRADNAIGAWRAFGHARRRLKGRWMRALGLFGFWLVAGCVALLLLVEFEWGRTAVSALAIGLLALLQILVLSVRPAVRVAAWGSYVALLDSAQPPPVLSRPTRDIPLPPSEPEPPRLDEVPLV